MSSIPTTSQTSPIRFTSLKECHQTNALRANTAAAAAAVFVAITKTPSTTAHTPTNNSRPDSGLQTPRANTPNSTNISPPARPGSHTAAARDLHFYNSKESTPEDQMYSRDSTPSELDLAFLDLASRQRREAEKAQRPPVLSSPIAPPFSTVDGAHPLISVAMANRADELPVARQLDWDAE